MRGIGTLSRCHDCCHPTSPSKSSERIYRRRRPTTSRFFASSTRFYPPQQRRVKETGNIDTHVVVGGSLLLKRGRHRNGRHDGPRIPLGGVLAGMNSVGVEVPLVLLLVRHVFACCSAAMRRRNECRRLLWRTLTRGRASRTTLVSLPLSLFYSSLPVSCCGSFALRVACVALTGKTSSTSSHAASPVKQIVVYLSLSLSPCLSLSRCGVVCCRAPRVVCFPSIAASSAGHVFAALATCHTRMRTIPFSAEASMTCLTRMPVLSLAVWVD